MRSVSGGHRLVVCVRLQLRAVREHGDLAEGEAGVAGRHPPVPEHLEAASAQGARAARGEERVEEHAAARASTVVEPGRARAARVGDVDDEVDHGLVEPGARRGSAETPASTSSTTAATTGAGSTGPTSSAPRTRSCAACVDGPRASASSSIAAWASYPTRWQTPASEETASKSRPMLDVGTQAQAGLELVRQQDPALVVGQARHAGQPGVPRDAGRAQVGRAPSGRGCGRRRRRPAAARTRGGPTRSNAGVVGEQELAAPDRAVVAVAGAVEGDAEHRSVTGVPVLGHRRRDVGVVVLHRARTGRPAACVARPGGGAVRRVPVGDERRGRDAGELLEVPLGGGRTPAGCARSSMSPTWADSQA